MPKPTLPKSLSAQLRDVRDFYEEGQDSLKDSRDRFGYGEANSSARNRNLHPEMLRKARQIVREFPADKFELLLASCAKREFRIGITHLMRLASVSKGRGRLIKRMLSGRWSLRRLNTEIAKVHPSTEGRGRRRHVADDRAGQLIELKRECDRWIRWNISPALEAGSNLGGSSSEKAPDKGQSLSAAVGGVLRAIKKLRALLVLELEQEPNPKKQVSVRGTDRRRLKAAVERRRSSGSTRPGSR